MIYKKSLLNNRTVGSNLAPRAKLPSVRKRLPEAASINNPLLPFCVVLKNNKINKGNPPKLSVKQAFL